MGVRVPTSVMAGVLCAALGMSGCSSGSDPFEGTTTTQVSPTTGSASAPTSTAHSAAPAPASVRAAVAKAYAEFFGYKTPVAVAEKYLQHGSVFASTLAAQARQGVQQRLTARVSKVVLLSPDAAAVTFTLLGGGKPLLPDSPGNAVREAGTWKVAAKTFCDLVQLQSSAPKQCNDPQLTAVPS
jgi:hypothetical protein